jgi:hypothetical protein
MTGDIFFDPSAAATSSSSSSSSTTAAVATANSDESSLPLSTPPTPQQQLLLPLSLRSPDPIGYHAPRDLAGLTPSGLAKTNKKMMAATATTATATTTTPAVTTAITNGAKLKEILFSPGDASVLPMVWASPTLSIRKKKSNNNSNNNNTCCYYNCYDFYLLFIELVLFSIPVLDADLLSTSAFVCYFHASNSFKCINFVC